MTRAIAPDGSTHLQVRIGDTILFVALQPNNRDTYVSPGVLGDRVGLVRDPFGHFGQLHRGIAHPPNQRLQRTFMRHRTVVIAGSFAVLLGVGVAMSPFVKVPRDPVEVVVAPLSASFATKGRAPPADAPIGDSRQPDVREMSESFRHTSLLVAIRRAGFYCDDVVAAHESAEGVWLASCRDLGGYKISVGRGGAFSVEPIAHNVDAVF